MTRVGSQRHQKKKNPFDKILAFHLGGPKLESSQGPATLTNILSVVLAHPRNL
jgi:hypothetical protein